MNLLVGAILVAFGIEDFRAKKISTWLLVLCVFVAGVYSIHRNGVWHSMLGIIPGVVLLLLGFLQPEMIGKGDGLLSIAYGSLYGWRKATLWLVFSFFAVAVVGVFVKVFPRKRNLQLPFMPFMCIVHWGMCL